MVSNFLCRLCQRKATDAGFCQGHRTEFLISGLPDNFAGRDSFVNQREAASVTRRRVLSEKPTPTPSKRFEPCQRVRKPCLRASRKPRKIRIVRIPMACMVPNCDRKHWSSGFCRLHSERWMKLDKPDKAEFAATTKLGPRIQSLGSCKVPSCGRELASTGMCSMHLMRWKCFGKPSIDEYLGTTPAGIARKPRGSNKSKCLQLSA